MDNGLLATPLALTNQCPVKWFSTLALWGKYICYDLDFMIKKIKYFFILIYFGTDILKP